MHTCQQRGQAATPPKLSRILRAVRWPPWCPPEATLLAGAGPGKKLALHRGSEQPCGMPFLDSPPPSPEDTEQDVT